MTKKSFRDGVRAYAIALRNWEQSGYSPDGRTQLNISKAVLVACADGHFGNLSWLEDSRAVEKFLRD